MDIDAFIAPPVLAGRLALVTGAGQGNGRAIARGLAAAGARVVVTDVDERAARETRGLIEAAGAQAWSFGLDVTDEPACRALAGQVDQAIGALDIVVNNAGIIIREGSDSPRAAENFRRVLDVNLTGTLNVTLATLGMLKRTRGTVVNIASIASTAGQGATLGYAPSKAGVKLLTQSHAAEFARFGIRVNAIAPGVIATPMTESTRADPSRLTGFMARTPMGRVGEPEELVGPVVFLVSPMASYVTGATLAVDGGFLAT
ncbi:MAG: SDR family oxidoreductase [Burkholderiaceae bacterium]